MILLLFLSIFSAETALARLYDTYRPDRRFKGAFCTAIGGACAADADLVTGIFENPAALATGEPDWDFDGDYATKSDLEPGMKDTTNRSESAGVLGLAYSTGSFGIGAAFAAQIDNVDTNLTIQDAAGYNRTLPMSNHSRLNTIRLPLAVQVGPDTSVGMAVSLTRHRQRLRLDPSNLKLGDSRSAWIPGFSVGAQHDLSPSWRLGSWFRFGSTIQETLSIDTSAGLYREDLELHSPWLWAIGAAHLFDEDHQLFAEVDLIGNTPGGYLYSYDTLSASDDAALARKGRALKLEPHAGFRFPLWTGTLFHLGSYYEADRTEDVNGRLHGTFGVSFCLFRTIDVIMGSDLASRYQQFIFTVR